MLSNEYFNAFRYPDKVIYNNYKYSNDILKLDYNPFSFLYKKKSLDNHVQY